MGCVVHLCAATTMGKDCLNSATEENLVKEEIKEIKIKMTNVYKLKRETTLNKSVETSTLGC